MDPFFCAFPLDFDNQHAPILSDILIKTLWKSIFFLLFRNVALMWQRDDPDRILVIIIQCQIFLTCSLCWLSGLFFPPPVKKWNWWVNICLESFWGVKGDYRHFIIFFVHFIFFKFSTVNAFSKKVILNTSLQFQYS